MRVAKEDITDMTFPYMLRSDHEGGEIQLVKRPTDIAAAYQSSKKYMQAIVLQAQPTETVVDVENNKHLSEKIYFKTISNILT